MLNAQIAQPAHVRAPFAAAPRVYSYARFSTPEQAQGNSLQRQTEAALKWTERKNVERLRDGLPTLLLDDKLRLHDLGVSAFRGANVAEGSELGSFLFACRSGLVPDGSYLLVESLDRVSRMTPRRVQRVLDDIVDAGVTICTMNDGQEYDAARLDGDPTALLIALMVSWRAHEESKVKAQRLAAAWDAAFTLQLRNSGVDFTCADNPDVNRLTIGLLAVINEDERERISERTKAALTAAKARGQRLGNPNGAAALRRAAKGNGASVQAIKDNAEAFAEGLRGTVGQIRAEGTTSLAGIAAELNARHMVTARGGKWHASSVRNLLTSRAYRERNGERPCTRAAQPAADAPQAFHLACAARVSRTSHPSKEAPARFGVCPFFAACALAFATA